MVAEVAEVEGVRWGGDGNEVAVEWRWSGGVGWLDVGAGVGVGAGVRFM